MYRDQQLGGGVLCRIAARARRVWIGAALRWTPAGYVFVDGYWDYPLEDRGLLFAPVYFKQPLWRNPDWCYQPSYVDQL